MYSALVELMQPEIDEAVKKVRAETWDEASSVTEAIKTVEAIDNLMRKLEMSKAEACSLLDTTPKQYNEYW